MGQPFILTIKTYKWLIYVFYNISEKLFLLNSLFSCLKVINWFYHLKNFYRGIDVLDDIIHGLVSHGTLVQSFCAHDVYRFPSSPVRTRPL